MSTWGIQDITDQAWLIVGQGWTRFPQRATPFRWEADAQAYLDRQPSSAAKPNLQPRALPTIDPSVQRGVVLNT